MMIVSLFISQSGIGRDDPPKTNPLTPGLSFPLLLQDTASVARV